MRHYKTAFHQHKVFSMDNYEKWAEEGCEDSYKIANKMWKQMLHDYERSAIDPATLEELNNFIAVHRAEIEAGQSRTEWRQ